MEFKTFIIKESQDFLAQKVGDILSALQSLSDDAEQLGNRPLIRAAQGITNQIRRILKDNWTDEDQPTLKLLQKIAVALMKAIDSNEDIRQVIATAAQVLVKGANDIKAPLNNIGSPEENPASS